MSVGLPGFAASSTPSLAGTGGYVGGVAPLPTTGGYPSATGYMGGPGYQGGSVPVGQTGVSVYPPDGQGGTGGMGGFFPPVLMPGLPAGIGQGGGVVVNVGQNQQAAQIATQGPQGGSSEGGIGKEVIVLIIAAVGAALLLGRQGRG